MARFFGYRITRDGDKNDNARNEIEYIEDVRQDGAAEISPGHYQVHGLSLDSSPLGDEVQLINRYRDLALQPEAQRAIEDVINEAFAYDDPYGPVDINLANVKIPEKTKKLIKQEFDYILQLLNFKLDCYEIFRRWYVDGRLYYQKVIDSTNPSKGILELKYIDPRRIKKIREQVNRNKRVPTFAHVVYNSIEVNKKFIEYYIYNPKGITGQSPTGISISPDSIVYVHSGLLDKSNSVVLSHLHQAIRPFNSLRKLEDSLIIYRLVRAPERRIFNIEVGNLPPQKAEQYVSGLIQRMSKKLKFDSDTGDIIDDKRVMTMNEDFWFPKRDGKGTTVEQLAGGASLGEMDDVEYFKKKLYESLHVPVSRLAPETNFNLGRASEINRDELKFSKFVARLRNRFSYLFLNILHDQLLLKNILAPDEWEEIRDNIAFDFNEDNFFTELKWGEIWQARIQNLQAAETFVGNWFSRNWARQNILHLTDEEWTKIQEELAKEKEEGAGDDDLDGLGDKEKDDKEKGEPDVAKPKPKPDEDDEAEETLNILESVT